ncbi:unnamed protein product [Trichogramma brassicae]|uniref:Uncharacterized protein n=1 Tax=Trichogramma brassicae TaxID=86971 RepID=A0A6H5IEE7_9HYME|nr:unnamed protein product [Trichogramma brassicae]
MLFKICDDKHQPLLVDARDRSGHTPLHLALAKSSYGKKNVIELLLRHGADPNLTNGWGYTLLHGICTDIHDLCFCAEILFQVCRKINRTVEVNARDKYGNTPLHLALEYKKLNLLDLLLRNGADPNSRNTKGLSPLHVICDEHHDYYDLMKMFFELCEQNNLRVQVNAQDEMGSPPLNIALSRRRSKYTTLLLAKGADPNLADAKGLTSLHIMSKECIGTICDNRFLDFFIKMCAKNNKMLQIDARDKSGCTPLQWAVASLMPKAIDILINNGADLSSFTFPDESHFDEIYHLNTYKFALRPVAGALATIERLRKRGYELDQSDALKIMKIFAIYGLFKKSTDVLKSLYDDKKFARKATELMVKPDLSFYKFIQLQPKECDIWSGRRMTHI